MMKEVVIVGGGLAGLTCAISLAKLGHQVLLFEKGQFPRHKVCGEYISREVEPLLRSLGLFPDSLQPVYVDRLKLSTFRGKVLDTPLPLGAFSISRYAFDAFLYEKAIEAGVEIRTGETVRNLIPKLDTWTVETLQGKQELAKVIVGCQGKLSGMDKQLDRSFSQKNSPWVGVKYHLSWNMPANEVHLHHFPKGYCGVSKVEGDKVNVCYLVHSSQLKSAGNLEKLEKQVLSQNPLLKSVLRDGKRLWKKPLTISNISFRPKAPEEQGILFAGDSAGLISPLCGNGMAMAIRSGYQLSVYIHQFLIGELSRKELEVTYSSFWQKAFGPRLWWGRLLQQLFWQPYLMDTLVGIGSSTPSLTRKIISFTHGKPISPIPNQHA